MGQKLVAGNYKSHALSICMVESSKQKTPGVTVALSIDEEGPYKGETIEWTGWLTAATKARTAESLSLVGCSDEDLMRVQTGEGAVPVSDPQVVIAVCEDEEWTTDKGEKRSTVRVRWINDPSRGGAAFAEMKPETKNKFGEELRGLLLAHKKPVAAGDGASVNALAGDVKKPKW
jgi:hypothetical protein